MTSYPTLPSMTSCTLKVMTFNLMYAHASTLIPTTGRVHTVARTPWVPPRRIPHHRPGNATGIEVPGQLQRRRTAPHDTHTQPRSKAAAAPWDGSASAGGAWHPWPPRGRRSRHSQPLQAGSREAPGTTCKTGSLAGVAGSDPAQLPSARLLCDLEQGLGVEPGTLDVLQDGY